MSYSLLLDTHALLWALNHPSRLSAAARRLYVEEDTHLYLSVASLWEIAIKISLVKLRMPEPVENYLPPFLNRHGIELLPIQAVHAYAVSTLPFHHRDPFDRLIIAQAIHENLPIMTVDRNFRNYPVTVVW